MTINRDANGHGHMVGQELLTDRLTDHLTDRFNQPFDL